MSKNGADTEILMRLQTELEIYYIFMLMLPTNNVSISK
jgi:hypothetical protein